MSFTKRGLPHKIVYASKNFTSGLTDISIRIKKPNGLIHQTGIMSESAGVGFEGIYEFVMNTNSVDPEGEYIVSIVSLTESHKAKTKVTVLDSIGGGGSVSDVSDVEIELDVTRPELKLNSVSNKTELKLNNSLTKLEAVRPLVDLKIDNDGINLDVSVESIELELECES